MADINPLPPPPPRPNDPQVGQAKPTTTPPPIVPRPPQPTPPQGLQVKSANMSGISPSPSQLKTEPQPPKPAPTPPAVPTPPIPPFKSSIRTMEEDLGRLKQTPPAPRAPIAPPSRPITPLAPPVPTAARPITVPSSVNIPPSPSGGGKKWLIIILLLIVLGGLGAWFFVFRGEPEITATPEPTFLATQQPTATPTPTPLNFVDIFRPSGAVSYSSTVSKTALSELEVSINQQALSTGELRVVNVTDAQGAQKIFAQFVTDLRLTVPADVMSALDPSQFYFTLFGKPDGKNGRGFIVRVQDKTKLETAMSAWEPALPQNLKDLFKLTITKAASSTFISVAHQTVAVRYKNFPDAFSTIDYSIVTLKNGETYLVVTNTRDHIFAIIDRAVGVVLGK